MMILDSCGVPSNLEQFSNFGMSSEARAVGQAHLWTNVVTSKGGTYRMCWCAGGMSCSLQEHFRVDMGTLMLAGPAPLQQDRTCVSGQTCFMSGSSEPMNSRLLPTSSLLTEAMGGNF